jgi:hypothetical protein
MLKMWKTCNANQQDKGHLEIMKSRVSMDVPCSSCRYTPSPCVVQTNPLRYSNITQLHNEPIRSASSFCSCVRGISSDLWMSSGFHADFLPCRGVPSVWSLYWGLIVCFALCSDTRSGLREPWIWWYGAGCLMRMWSFASTRWLRV